jgi:hypothetical protein
MTVDGRALPTTGALGRPREGQVATVRDMIFAWASYAREFCQRIFRSSPSAHFYDNLKQAARCLR